MTPIDAVKAEACAELDALARRLGSATAPRAIVIRIELDDRTGMPKAVECQEERRRHVLGGAIASKSR